MAEIFSWVKGVPDVMLLIRFLEEQLSYTPVTKADVKVDATKRNKAPVYHVVSTITGVQKLV